MSSTSGGGSSAPAAVDSAAGGVGPAARVAAASETAGGAELSTSVGAQTGEESRTSSGGDDSPASAAGTDLEAISAPAALRSGCASGAAADAAAGVPVSGAAVAPVAWTDASGVLADTAAAAWSAGGLLSLISTLTSPGVLLAGGRSGETLGSGGRGVKSSSSERPENESSEQSLPSSRFATSAAMFDRVSRAVKLARAGSRTDACACMLEHFLKSQTCFFNPGPPNFGLSRHLPHVPQSSRRQPGHAPHRLLFVPGAAKVCINGLAFMPPPAGGGAERDVRRNGSTAAKPPVEVAPPFSGVGEGGGLGGSPGGAVVAATQAARDATGRRLTTAESFLARFDGGGPSTPGVHAVSSADIGAASAFMPASLSARAGCRNLCNSYLTGCIQPTHSYRIIIPRTHTFTEILQRFSAQESYSTAALDSRHSTTVLVLLGPGPRSVVSPRSRPAPPCVFE